MFKKIKKIKSWVKNKLIRKPNIIPRSEHSISRKNISPNALKVIYRLRKKGFKAYLVGGGIRDLLLGNIPKDFDVATNAKPEEIAKQFYNSRVIGRRFLIVHVFFGQEIIEVATFRADSSHSKNISEEGMLVSDNVYGKLEDDVVRRDFTINAIYYDVKGFKLIDYFDGYKDIQNKEIRIIGNPSERYREDPVRMLRAIRFAGKLGFKIHKDTEKPIKELSNLLTNIAPARLFEEYLKLFLSGSSKPIFDQLILYDILGKLFPLLVRYTDSEQVTEFVNKSLINTDHRISEAKTVNPAFLLAVFLWPAFTNKYQQLIETNDNKEPLEHEAMDLVIAEQQLSMTIPKRFSYVIREIWVLQNRLGRRTGARAGRVFSSPKFRAGYDFLLLRAEAQESEEVVSLANWWTQYIKSEDKQRFIMVKELTEKKPKKKRKYKSKTKKDNTELDQNV